MGLKIVVSIGLPRSGTTWAFNTTQSILKDQGFSYLSLFTNQEEISESIPLINENSYDFLLIKTHKIRVLKTISSFLPGLIIPNVIISVRDPLQTALSQMRVSRQNPTKTNYSRISKKMQNMFNYNRRLDNTLSQVSSLVLVKESEIESPNQCNNKIQQISDLLFGKGLPDMNVDSIRNMNSLEQVKNFIDENFDSEEKLSFEKYDKTTHYHANHIKTKDYSINRESIDQESLASAEKANDDFISKYENTFCRYQPTEVTASTAIEILKALKITILPK